MTRNSLERAAIRAVLTSLLWLSGVVLIFAGIVVHGSASLACAVLGIACIVAAVIIGGET